MKKYNEEDFIQVCKECHTAAEAAAKLGIAFSTFKRKALKLGCYNTNQSGKGIRKKTPSIPLEDILAGLHPHYNTFKLKNRLYKAGLKKNKCEKCGIDSWCGEELSCELDHVDGNPRNHLLSNLRILCRNCHGQTDTFRSKIRK
jgi:hypothetical protein